MSHSLSRLSRLAAGSLLLPLCFLALPAYSKESAPQAGASDAQILDFMADWQGDDGQWTDPMTFARIDPAKVKTESAKRNGKPVPPPVAATGVPPAATSMDHSG